MCAVWFLALKVKGVFMSYVIDTTHLQYQLSTQEGDVAQKWSCSRSLNAWKTIVDFKIVKVLRSVLIQTFDKMFSILPQKLKSKIRRHLNPPFYPLNTLHIVHKTCLNVLAQFQGPNVSLCWWLTCCQSNDISVKLFVGQFLHVCMYVWFIGDMWHVSVVAVFDLCGCACE